MLFLYHLQRYVTVICSVLAGSIAVHHAEPSFIKKTIQLGIFTVSCIPSTYVHAICVPWFASFHMSIGHELFVRIKYIAGSAC